jgi:hypothetical protein
MATYAEQQQRRSASGTFRDNMYAEYLGEILVPAQPFSTALKKTATALLDTVTRSDTLDGASVGQRLIRAMRGFGDALQDAIDQVRTFAREAERLYGQAKRILRAIRVVLDSAKAVLDVVKNVEDALQNAVAGVIDAVESRVRASKERVKTRAQSLSTSMRSMDASAIRTLCREEPAPTLYTPADVIRDVRASLDATSARLSAAAAIPDIIDRVERLAQIVRGISDGIASGAFVDEHIGVHVSRAMDSLAQATESRVKKLICDAGRAVVAAGRRAIDRAARGIASQRGTRDPNRATAATLLAYILQHEAVRTAPESPPSRLTLDVQARVVRAASPNGVRAALQERIDAAVWQLAALAPSSFAHSRATIVLDRMVDIIKRLDDSQIVGAIGQVSSMLGHPARAAFIEAVAVQSAGLDGTSANILDDATLDKMNAAHQASILASLAIIGNVRAAVSACSFVY